MHPDTYFQQAIKAEENGVPVNWKDVAATMYTTLRNVSLELATLKAEIEAQKEAEGRGDDDAKPE